MIRTVSCIALVVAFAPSAAFAYGEADGDRHGLEERALHFYTDRLRVEPDATDPQFGTYDPVHPLVYNPDLNDAARWYAEDMEAHGCFPPDHSSCDGTSFGERVGGFYEGSAIGENIAMGGLTPSSVVFDAWLYSDGHRENMLRAGYQELGPGFAGTPFNSSWWVQDFGARGGVPDPVVTSATHDPLWPNPGAPLEFFAAVHDADGAPAAVSVVVDGLCYAMDPDRGSGGDRTYATTVQTSTQGCLAYYIAVVTVDGERVTYPTEGSLLASVDEAECEIWMEEQLPSECAPDADGDSGFGGRGAGCGSAGGADDNVGADAEYGTCSLSPTPRSNSPLVLATLLLGATRRRTGRTAR